MVGVIARAPISPYAQRPSSLRVRHKNIPSRVIQCPRDFALDANGGGGNAQANCEWRYRRRGSFRDCECPSNDNLRTGWACIPRSEPG